MSPTLSIPDAIPELEADLPAESFAQLSPLWLWAGLGLLLALLAAGVALLLWRRRQRRQTGEPESPLALALRRTDEVAAELPPLRACSLQLSFIIRSYLAGCAQDPALFETHEEFSRRMDSLETLPESCRYNTRELLEDLAANKYAPAAEQGQSEARALVERTRSLLVQVDRSRAEAQEGGAA